MNKAYIVMKKGYEYDDNTYNETEGGHPQIICFSKEDAKMKVKELNAKEYQEVSILDYAYENDCLTVELRSMENLQVNILGIIPRINFILKQIRMK